MATSILGQTAVRAAKLEVVTELPKIGKKNQIYLVPNKSSVSGDVYDEYIWINDTWEFLGNKRLELTIDSFLKPDSTNPVENEAIYWRFLGVDKEIEKNRNNIGVLTGRVNKVDGIAKGAEELAKVNEERLNGVQATANEAKASVEGLTTVVRRAENNISQLKELNVVYPNNIRSLTTESTGAEVMEAFVPAIGGSAGEVNTPHVGYLIKGAAHRDSPEDTWKSDPDSTIISVEVVKIDNKDCHKFMYIDNNRDLVTMTVCIWGGTFKVIERSVVSNINTIVDKINTFDKKLNSGTLRDLYISAGAVYNEATGFYELNGLTDITEEEMRKIYLLYITNSPKAEHLVSWLSYPNDFRTNIAPMVIYVSNIQNSIDRNNVLEVLVLSASSLYIQKLVATAHGSFPKLRRVVGYWVYVNNNPSNYNFDYGQPFQNCPLLEEIRMKGINKSHTFAVSPNLSKESVLYMITNANPPSGAAVGSITITLHPTAYARLKDDADIVAALEAKGGIITLVSA
ncbi:hypothetical protein [Intestinibacter sp.]|uniref:hypothetical protein n=1 Tax=Intestinibacter sp. TaxID=1965304 RepID=UPI002A750B8D|nr:hypothetical protein [Intestinibacter sp.]MDY2736753.1 hypothetical protein [Intestinibacter sp.]